MLKVTAKQTLHLLRSGSSCLLGVSLISKIEDFNSAALPEICGLFSRKGPTP